MAKKILVYTNHYFPENFKINDIVNHFDDQEYSVKVITGIPNYPSGKIFQNYGYFKKTNEIKGNIKIRRLPLIARGKGSSFRLFLNYLSYFFSVLIYTIYLILSNKKYDLIFVHHTSPIFIAISPCIYKVFNKQAKMILWDLDIWPESIEATGAIKNKKILKNVKKLVSNSEYLRPKKLARKNTTDLEVIQYEMKRYSKILKKDYDFVCILQPTSPLRSIEHLIQCLNNIKKSNYDALWTVSRIDRKFNSIKQLVLDNDILKYHHPHGSQFTSRQNLEDTYIRNGVAYFYSFDAIYKYKNVLPKKSGYLIIKDRIVNIDTKEDFDLAKKYFKNIK